MKTLIVILIIASFVQSTILPIDLVLIILICRSYVKSDQTNLFLAFGFGLLVSHLELTPFGLPAIIYLLIVQITQTFAKSRLAGNWLLIIPISLVFLSLNQLTISMQLSTKVIIESLLALPIFYIVRLWEERFILQKEIKLKV